MSLILKGIDLPKEGNDECKMLTVDIFPSGNIQVTEQGDGCCDGYSLDKSAIQIPKGARLIDANALLENMYTIVRLTGKGEQIETVVYADDIEDAPTILESEEE